MLFAQYKHVLAFEQSYGIFGQEGSNPAHLGKLWTTSVA